MATKKINRQLAITAGFLVPLAVAAVLLLPRHAGQPVSTTHSKADMMGGSAIPTSETITSSLKEGGVPTQGLTVAVVDDIVVIRGSVTAPEDIARITTIAKQSGASRVANMVQASQKPDDLLIKQQAERELMLSRALQGCRFHVQSAEGILTVNATVQSDLQEDAARAILRRVRGTQKVEAQFARF